MDLHIECKNTEIWEISVMFKQMVLEWPVRTPPPPSDPLLIHRCYMETLARSIIIIMWSMAPTLSAIHSDHFFHHIYFCSPYFWQKATKPYLSVRRRIAKCHSSSLSASTWCSPTVVLTFTTRKYFCINHGDQKVFQFEIIINVLVSSFSLRQLHIFDPVSAESI